MAMRVHLTYYRALDDAAVVMGKERSLVARDGRFHQQAEIAQGSSHSTIVYERRGGDHDRLDGTGRIAKRQPRSALIV